MAATFLPLLQAGFVLADANTAKTNAVVQKQAAYHTLVDCLSGSDNRKTGIVGDSITNFDWVTGTVHNGTADKRIFLDSSGTPSIAVKAPCTADLIRQALSVFNASVDNPQDMLCNIGYVQASTTGNKTSCYVGDTNDMGNIDVSSYSQGHKSSDGMSCNENEKLIVDWCYPISLPIGAFDGFCIPGTTFSAGILPVQIAASYTPPCPKTSPTGTDVIKYLTSLGVYAPLTPSAEEYIYDLMKWTATSNPDCKQQGTALTHKVSITDIGSTGPVKEDWSWGDSYVNTIVTGESAVSPCYEGDPPATLKPKADGSPSDAATAFFQAAYADAAKDACPQQVGDDQGLIDICIDGAVHRDTPDYCANTYKDDPAKQAACDAGTNIAIATVASTGDDNSSKSSCAVPGVGWLICPIMNFLGDIANAMYNVLQGFLEVQPSMFAPNSAAYKAYQNFLPLANIILVVLFLVIVYSTATGNGFGALSNYDVKKILPRLLIFAILLNLSWYICAAAVDLSNILGANAKGLFNGLTSGLPTQPGSIAEQGNGWTGLIAFALAGAVIGVFVGLSVIIPLVLAVIVALLMMFLILIVRQAGVILLCVIAPLAFAAAMLPNTKTLFDKWWKMFSSLLVVYPIIGVIYGASALAGAILLAQANTADSFALKVAAAACEVLPLFAVPSILKGSLNGLGALGAAVGGFAAGRMSSAGGRVKSSAQSGYQNSVGRSLGLQARGLGARQLSKIPILRNNRGLQRVAAAGNVEAARRSKEMVEMAGTAFSDYTIAQLSEAAMTGKSRDGRQLTKYEKIAALQAAGPNLTGDQAHKIAVASKNEKDQDVRIAMGKAVSNVKGKTGLPGSQLGTIDDGSFDDLKANAGIIKNLKGDTLGGMDESEITRMVKLAQGFNYNYDAKGNMVWSSTQERSADNAQLQNILDQYTSMSKQARGGLTRGSKDILNSLMLQPQPQQPTQQPQPQPQQQAQPQPQPQPQPQQTPPPTPPVPPTPTTPPTPTPPVPPTPGGTT